MTAAEGLGKFFVIAAAAVLTLGTMLAQATTYHVSQSSGNDSWTGQAASPDGLQGA
jgi:hypothetical protein